MNFHHFRFKITKFILLFAQTDINECSEETDDCDRLTQLCLNTPGSFRCQQKVVEKCLHGLRENPVTRLCEGAFSL
jgi:hypothetical protein